MRILLILTLLLMLAGCVGNLAFDKGIDSYASGDYDAAVLSFADAANKNPDSAEYQARLQLARQAASAEHEKLGNGLMANHDYLGALKQFIMAKGLDASNESSVSKVRQAELHIEAEKMVAEAKKLLRDRHLKQGYQVVGDVLDILPDYQPALDLRDELERRSATMIDGVELEVTSDEPITLNFKGANLPDVFDILTQLSGIRFILDDDIRNQTTTLFLQDATFAQAFELLLRMNKLDKKILNSKTIIIFPNSKDKQKQFADQIIQTFYLSNIDAKKAVNLLRTMLQVRKIYVHEELNAIVLRDSPEVIRLAQKILEANDRANSEVVFDLELVEVAHINGLDVGTKLSSNSVQVGVTGVPNVDRTTDNLSIKNIVVDDLSNLNFLYGIPFATFDFLMTNGDAEILASPKIRVQNKGKAKVHIGSREPVVTVTINDTQTSENVQYVDVGVKLDVEPIIKLDNTIVTKLGLEVSNVSDRSTTSNGTVVLTISTTNANTELILKDGVQTIIGGLLRDDQTQSKIGIPILSDLPFIGSIFTHYSTNKIKREILLSITPHIVRSVRLPEGNSATIWSGGEDHLRVGRNFGSFADEYIEGQGKTPNLAVPAQAPLKSLKSLQSKPEAPEMAPQSSGPEETQLPVSQEPEVGAVPGQSTVATTAVQAPIAQVLNAPPPVSVEAVPELVLPGAVTPESITKPSIFLAGDRLVEIDHNFSVTLSVQDIENLFSAPLYIRFDPKLVDFVSASEGQFLGQGGQSTIFTSTEMVGTGRVILGLKQGAGGKGASGGGELATLEFKAKAAGKLSIAPERINFRNPAGERLPTDSRGLIVEVK